MKRIMFATIAAASVVLLAAGCGSDSDPDDTSAAGTTAAQSSADPADAAATGDVYLDTCNGVLTYLDTMKESGLAADDAAVQAIGDEFLAAAEAEADWASKSDQDRADFERGVNAAVAGSC